MPSLKDIEDKIKKLEMDLKDGKSDRNKCLDELQSLHSDRIKLLKKNKNLVSTLYQSTPLPPNASSQQSTGLLSNVTGYFWSNKNEEKEEKERREAAEFENRMRQQELKKQERREKMLAEQAAFDLKIQQATISANEKQSAIAKCHQQQVEQHLVTAQQKEKEREAQHEETMAEMAMEAEKEFRRLEDERRLAREEEERKNSEWRRNLARENYNQEQLTSQMISESQKSLDRQEAVNRQKHLEAEKNLTELKEQYSEERAAMLRELQRIDEEVKRSQEECRRKYEEMRRRSEEQLAEMLRLLKLAQWNRTIEENWSNRLKALKSTDRRVYRAMGQLRVQLAVAKVKELNVEFVRREVDRLKTEVSEVQRVMDREVENLRKMYDFSGKQFVLDIENSLSDISTVCSKLTSYLDSQQTIPKLGKPEASEFYNRIEDFENEFSDVYKKIPTMSSLKSKYSFDYNFDEKLAIEDGGSVVQIEEIE